MIIKPLCKYFKKCNGCTAQHIPYSLQLENKRNRVEHATGSKDIKVYAGHEYYYRNRMDFIVSKGQLWLRGINGFVQTDECVISDKRINDLLQEARNFFKDNFPDSMRFVVIRATKTCSISFVCKDASAMSIIQDFAKISTADNVLIAYGSESISDDYVVLKGSPYLLEEFNGIPFYYHSQSFFQINSEVATMMHQHCHTILKKYAPQPCLLDVYGGVGCFGILNADLFKSVIIVENAPLSVKAAFLNIKHISNGSVIEADARQIKKMQHGSIVILDPPRSGMDQKVIQALKEVKPKVIIYISCNIVQLKKDLTKFKEYKMKSVALFDLFPQTPHIETMVELAL